MYSYQFEPSPKLGIWLTAGQLLKLSVTITTHIITNWTTVNKLFGSLFGAKVNIWYSSTYFVYPFQNNMIIFDEHVDSIITITGATIIKFKRHFTLSSPGFGEYLIDEYYTSCSQGSRPWCEDHSDWLYSRHKWQHCNEVIATKNFWTTSKK